MTPRAHCFSLVSSTLLASLVACSRADPADSGPGPLPGTDAATANDASQPGMDAGAPAPDAMPPPDASNTGRDAGHDAASDAGIDAARPGWTLVWSDEFDAPDGTAV